MSAALWWAFTCLLTNSLSLISLLINFSHGFNVDLATRVVQQGEQGSYFGYSIDLYSGSDGDWLLVGAPRASTSTPGVEQGGAVFRCLPDRIYCSKVAFDDSGPKVDAIHGIPTQMEIKSNQLFGSTVRSTSNGSKILACAPHYRAYYPRFDRLSPVGSCWMLHGRNKGVAEEYAPCRQQRKWGRHRLGYCMAGFSVALAERGDQFYLGAPGAFYWQGALIAQRVGNKTFIDHTQIGPAYTDDRYLGYDTITFDFNADGGEDIAISAPKGGDGQRGLVVLYDSSKRNLLNLTGEQTGSYFGGSLAAGDIDGDDRDDIIVGAPTYSLHTQNKGSLKTKYEVGRVYVFFQDATADFGQRAELTGTKEWARFGFSLAYVGDLNADGYGDIIVGAPWDGPKRRGAVYVFNGRPGGIHDKPSQVIYAEDVETRGVRPSPTAKEPVKTGLSTFGFSLAGGRDVDKNGFADLAVGAYKSDRAVIFRTRPLVTLQGKLRVSPDVLDLEDRRCELQNGAKVACGKVTYCLRQSSKGTEGGPVDVNALIQLDVDKGLANRTLFLEPPYRSRSSIDVPMVLDQHDEDDEASCATHHFYVKEDIRDKLTPIIITTNYSLVDKDPGTFKIKPVLDAYGTTSMSHKLDIKKECGPDNICIPNLQVYSNVQACHKEGTMEVCEKADVFTIGADDHLNITVTVHNDLEDAYESQLFFQVPPGVDYDEYVKITPDFPAICSAPSGFESHDKTKAYNLTCDIGNPLPSKDKMILSFKLSVKDLSKTIDLRLVTNSTNPEQNETLFDNVQVVSIPIEAKPFITFLSASQPASLGYDKDDMQEPVEWDFHIGPNVTHNYQVRNDGPTVMRRADLDVYWPIKSRSGGKHYLLYLSVNPQVWGNGTCYVRHAVNPEHYGLHYTGEGRRRQRRDLGSGRRSKRQEELEEDQPIYARTFRRLINKLKDWKNGGDRETVSELRAMRIDCRDFECAHIECQIGPLQPGADAVVHIESWLYVKTLLEEATYDAEISSVGVLKVTELPYKMEKMPTEAVVTTTAVSPRAPIKADRGIPWWIILIAILAGLALLALLVLLLWKCGFFERKKPPKEKALLEQAAESQYYGYPMYGTHL